MPLPPPPFRKPYRLFIFMGVSTVLLPILVVLVWCFTTEDVNRAVHVVSITSKHTHMDLLHDIMDSAGSLLPINSTAVSLSKLLSSSVQGSLSLFSTIESEVNPKLFLAFSTIPHLSQISYIGEDGLLFSYYREGNQTFALFVNTSDSSVGFGRNNSYAHNSYVQPINDITGERYGEAIDSDPAVHSSLRLLYSALNQRNGNAVWGLGWGKSQDPLFLFIATVKNVHIQDQQGVVSLGVPLECFRSFISTIESHDGYFYLTTEDGHFVAQRGPPNSQLLFNNGTVSVQATKSDKSVKMEPTSSFSCNLTHYHDDAGNLLSAATLVIQGISYRFYCAPVQIAGIQSVAVLIFPQKGLNSLVQKQNMVSLALLVLMIVLVIFVTSLFVFMIYRAARQEIFLCSAVIKQMEATQQAERTSKNNSTAFARTSHDVRTSLAAISSLIELCRGEVSPHSRLETNLVQMNSCASNLLGILNSFLDASKIESGKMKLDEVEFDLAQVLEEVVNMFHIVALKKGIEVILDPCDESILRFSHVKGDCGRLKQILCNLLSNAVKFTSEGHVVVRAWANKPNLENSISSNHSSHFCKLRSCISRLISKRNRACNDLGSLHRVPQTPNCMEFVFEVDDTGKGIPKEKQKSVFENFVQVTEMASSRHEGTGLGLGIVQSLVCLMGGQIGIVDKEPGATGTCFRFSVLVRICEAEHFMVAKEDSNLPEDRHLNELHPNTSCNKIPSNIRASTFNKCFMQEGVHAILLIQGDEGRRISKKWMENHGIKVWLVSQLEDLCGTLEKLKEKSYSASLRSYSDNSLSYNSSGQEEGSAHDNRIDHWLSPSLINGDLHRKSGLISKPACVLVIIDMSYGSFLKMCTILNDFKQYDHDFQSKVVWLMTPNTPIDDLKSLKSRQAPCDLVLKKPFHGSRLHAVLTLLQRSGETCEGHALEIRIEHIVQDVQHSNESDSSMKPIQLTTDPVSLPSNCVINQRMGIGGAPNSEKPLSGMNILVVDDNCVLLKFSMTLLFHLGATVEGAENGEEALNVFHKALNAMNHDGGNFAYDNILMDCEMPIMNGYEATRRIRIEEKLSDLCIPIIALSAHAMPEELSKSIEAGMDMHLMKPLTAELFVEAVQKIRYNGKCAETSA